MKKLERSLNLTSVIAISIGGMLGSGIFVLPGLSAGTYAFSVIYDEDSDGELKTGFLGIPKEKVAVSNNARPRFGPPRYKDAVFTLSESTRMSVRLDDAQ